MESPGEYLKRERELRGVPLSRIFEKTRVPLKFLEALEEDAYETLPHTAFVKGYIKSYCKALGLDETDAALRYEVFIKERAAEEELKHRPRQEVSRPVAPSGSRDSGPRNTNAFKAVIASAAGVAMIMAAFALFSGKKTDDGLAVTALPPQAPAAVEATAPQAGSAFETIPAAKPAVAERAPAVPAATGERPAQPAKAAEPALKLTPLVRVEGTPEPRQAKETTVAAPAQKEASPQETRPFDTTAAQEPAAKERPAQAVGHTLSIRARETAWVKVRIDGKDPFEVLLKEGERVEWKAGEVFSIILGNAGGVDLALNGKSLSAQGKSGEVVSLRLPASDAGARPADAGARQ